MVTSIPASRIVSVRPSVQSAGGTGLDLCGLILTNNTRVPIGTVQGFADAAAVGAFFGLSSAEYAKAVIYFNGFANATIAPANLLFSQYASAAVVAYLQGGPVTSLAAVQALSGTLSLTIDGTPITSSAINLATVTSFSAAAAEITEAIGVHEFSGTVTTASGSPLLTVTAVSAGTLAVGDPVTGTGIPAGAYISSLGTGTGGTGTYNMSVNATASGSVTVQAWAVICSYDSVSSAFIISGAVPGTGGVSFPTTNALSTGLGLTAATGALISPASPAMTPAGAMATVTAATQDFASFTTAFKPADADMVAFAAWNNGAANRYVYCQWDNNVALTTTSYAATAWGQIQAATYAATLPIYDPNDGFAIAVFAMAVFAATDHDAVQGRVNLAFQSQSGLAAGVTSDLIAGQLEANGVNFYGSYSTAAQGFVFFWNGGVSGPFLWADTLVNQIWMTNAFQLALMTLLTSVKSIPYNDAGAVLIEETLGGPIDAALAFGAIQAGVTLSSGEIVAINAVAGANVAPTIERRGWYLQVGQASPQVRAARGSPPINFWYTDGGSVQRIALNSVEVQ